MGKSKIKSKMYCDTPVSDGILASLEELEPGSDVAVMTLLGSLCPITLSHVAAFEEGRRLLLGGTISASTNKPKQETPNAPRQRPPELEHFDRVIGFVSLNPDSYLDYKFSQRGTGLSSPPLNFDERTELVQLAISDQEDWMGIEDWEGCSIQQLEQSFPLLNFVHFYLNGADDVVKYKKWKRASEHRRFITMGRPGVTELLLEHVEKTKVNPAYFVIGPELEDISSTKARHAVCSRNLKELDRLLSPKVIKWCLDHHKAHPSKWGGHQQDDTK